MNILSFIRSMFGVKDTEQGKLELFREVEHRKLELLREEEKNREMREEREFVYLREVEQRKLDMLREIEHRKLEILRDVEQRKLDLLRDVEQRKFDFLRDVEQKGECETKRVVTRKELNAKMDNRVGKSKELKEKRDNKKKRKEHKEKRQKQTIKKHKRNRVVSDEISPESNSTDQLQTILKPSSESTESASINHTYLRPVDAQDRSPKEFCRCYPPNVASIKESVESTCVQSNRAEQNVSKLYCECQRTERSGDNLKLPPAYPAGVVIKPSWGVPVRDTSEEFTAYEWQYCSPCSSKVAQSPVTVSYLHCQGSMECPNEYCSFRRRPRSSTKGASILNVNDNELVNSTKLTTTIRTMLIETGAMEDPTVTLAPNCGTALRYSYNSGPRLLQRYLLQAMNRALVCERCLLMEKLVCFMNHVPCKVSSMLHNETGVAWMLKKDMQHTHDKHKAL